MEGVPLPVFPSGRLRDPRGVAVAVGRCRLVLSSASAPVQMYVQPPVGLRGNKTRCGGMVWPWACLLRFLLPYTPPSKFVTRETMVRPVSVAPGSASRFQLPFPLPTTPLREMFGRFFQ